MSVVAVGYSVSVTITKENAKDTNSNQWRSYTPTTTVTVTVPTTGHHNKSLPFFPLLLPHQQSYIVRDSFCNFTFDYISVEKRGKRKEKMKNNNNIECALWLLHLALRQKIFLFSRREKSVSPLSLLLQKCGEKEGTIKSWSLPFLNESIAAEEKGHTKKTYISQVTRHFKA